MPKDKHLDFCRLYCSTIFRLLLHDVFRYNLMWEVDLEKLPMKELTTEDALLFVWVTNKQKLVRYVKETLFPLWSVQLLTQWYWLKVDMNFHFLVTQNILSIAERNRHGSSRGNCNPCRYRTM